MNRILYILLAALAVGVGVSALHYLTRGEPAPPVSLPSEMSLAGSEAAETRQRVAAENITVTMKTSHGDIMLELFAKDAPRTLENFVKLSREGFYDGTKFHRVIKGFMIQGGDPNSKDDDWSDDGTGGPGYQFEDEINARKIVRGALAMANAGPGTNGSQFFIVTADAAPWLDGKHTVFGRVAAGMDVVDKIENVRTDKAKGDHPIENVTVTAVEILKQ